MTAEKRTGDKIALITGGGTGIGLASAKALIKKGFFVIICGRRPDVLEKAIAELPNGTAVAIPANVADPTSVEKLFAEIQKRFSRLDLLFNNAGMGAFAVPIEELPFEQWQQVVNVNLTGSFLCTQAAIKLMKQQRPMGGRIINNGSISAETPRPHSAPYTATKHAITGLTKSTALDCRPYNIACCQINIGNAETELLQATRKGTLQSDMSVKPEPTMDVSHAGETVAYMASLPLDANALFVTVMATNMPFVGRG